MGRILMMLCGVLAVAAAADDSTALKHWELGPFVRDDGADRLGPIAESAFPCPIRGESVHWEDKDLLCAAAVVKDGKAYLLYRAEDRSRGDSWGTSRIGLAVSEDGRRFTRRSEPILYPAEDACKKYEWPGGCQDPRVVLSEDGEYVMTYTAFDGKLARLFVATSRDLVHWEKKGSAFARFKDGKYVDTWSKSGAVVCRREKERFVAAKVNGKYWMYYGDTGAILASSDNLIDWGVSETAEGKPLVVLPMRPGRFDSHVAEPGPFALLTGAGIHLIYNGGSDNRPDLGLKGMVWAVAQALFDAKDPARVLARSEKDFFHPERDFETRRQGSAESGNANVTFVESLIWFDGTWRFYYGCADSFVASAFCRPEAGK